MLTIEKSHRDILRDALLNLALAFLKLQRHAECADACSRVLDGLLGSDCVDSVATTEISDEARSCARARVKALLRRAQARCGA